MTKYEIYIKRKDHEFRFEDENLKTFKEGLADFLSVVEEFDKQAAALTGKSDRRGGGRRPPFVKNAIMDLIKEEPQWFVNKFSEQVKDKIATEYGAVGAKNQSVNVALIRLFSKGILTRGESEGKYAYSVPSIKH
jgi:hypothetical protein